MTTSIYRIIKKHEIEPGSPMKNVSGEDIEGTVVLTGTSFLHRLTDGAYGLTYENTLDGGMTSIYLDGKAIAALRAALV